MFAGHGNLLADFPYIGLAMDKFLLFLCSSLFKYLSILLLLFDKPSRSGQMQTCDLFIQVIVIVFSKASMWRKCLSGGLYWKYCLFLIYKKITDWYSYKSMFKKDARFYRYPFRLLTMVGNKNFTIYAHVLNALCALLLQTRPHGCLPRCQER